jgi:hypothetical protein
MEERHSSEDIIRSAFTPIIGLFAWGAEKGQGSMLTFEFGDPHLSVREPITASPTSSPKIRKALARRRVRPHGVWYLWIYCCNWRISAQDLEIAHSEASNEAIVEAVKEIDGQKLLSLDVDPSQGTSCFRFDLGASLETWPYGESRDDEQWLLYEKDGKILSFHADGHCSWETSN